MRHIKITSRTQLLNFVIQKHNFKSYLEIGIEDGYNFNSIKCDYKIGVDPDITCSHATHFGTSDDFFAKCNISFDLIFVDGLHVKNQVEKDILNAIKFINPKGVIIVHDCNPLKEIWQKVPRTTQYWFGDVWKAFVKFKNEYNCLTYVIDIDCGCGIIENGFGAKKIKKFVNQLNWKDLDRNRKKLLNLISIAEWSQKYSLL